MRAEAAIRRLERRVDELERGLTSGGRDPEAQLRRARALLFEFLQDHKEVDALEFAIRNDLTLESVERALDEFERKGWTVAVDDEEG